MAHSFNILIRSCLQSCFSSRLTLLKRRADYRDMAESSDNSRRLWQSSEQETWTMSLKQSRDGRGGAGGARADGERRDLGGVKVSEERARVCLAQLDVEIEK